MSQQGIQILTPVGRMVQGHPFRKNTTNMEGKPLTDNDGNPRVEYFVAIAIPKTDQGFNDVWQKMWQVAQSGFPNGEYNQQGFAWKYVDGDDPKYAQKEGFPGNHILRLTGGFAPKVYTKDGAAQIVDEKQIKTGDYIRAYIDCRPNGSSRKPGIFLNPSLIELVGYGEEIISGPDGAQIFGGAPAANLPAGASMTPTAGTPIATPGNMPQQNNNMSPTPGQPAAQQQNNLPPTPGNSSQPPAPRINAVPGQPPMMPAAQQQPQQPQYTMTAKAGAFTREQMHATGWTDAQLIEHGYMQQTNGSTVTPHPGFLNGPQ